MEGGSKNHSAAQQEAVDLAKFLHLADPKTCKKELIQGYLEKGSVSEAEQLIAHRFLMCYIVYLNAQRQGAVVTLTLQELQRAASHKRKTATLSFCTQSKK